jgi:signal transduction histidine kinase
VLAVPLMRKKQAIGTISVTRRETGGFSRNQVDLLKTFADQAVIAIENAGLFNESKEALERQKASGEVLGAISGSISDTKPVFDRILQSCEQLFAGRVVGINVVGADGRIHIGAFRGEGSEKLAQVFPLPLDENSGSGAAIVRCEVLHYPDVENGPDVPPPTRRGCIAIGIKSLIFAPMISEEGGVGAIFVGRRYAIPFSEKEAELLQSFANQAAIAIKNARLFNETKEALEQQTATAEILQVISSSPTDTQPVFDAIVQSGLRLFPDAAVVLGIPAGARVRAAAIAHADPAIVQIMRSQFPIPLSRDWMHATAIIDGELIDIPDAEAEKGDRYAAGIKNLLASGYRATTIAPMICGDAAIGAISVSRPKPGPLSEKQVALLRTFAAQAVIAIENVRVFKELEARTGALSRSVEQLTALGEVGRAISSTLDLETVLRTIVARAVQLTGLDGGTIYEYDERSEEFNLRAAENLSEEIVEMLRETPMRKGEGAIGHAVETGAPTEIADMRDESYQSPRRDFLIRAGYRALLVVPLRRDERIIGALAVNRRAPGNFSNEVVELLKTFATQSAMAIQNARLFREIAVKSRQLEEASQHKSQFLASMSHELRTPLNAILGLNEMILGRIYGDVPTAMQAPLAQIQLSGKHLLGLINNVLDLAKIEAGRMELSLSDYLVQDVVASVQSTLRPLAAEKGLQFLACMPNDMPLAYGDAGRIVQCLINLAGNSIKFTKAGKVEISAVEKDGLLTYRVADTGIGIPPDKIGGLFIAFKQSDSAIAREHGGTGLGLSICRKFVEMHGGRIWVESEPGKGSAFIFEVPLRVQTP